MKTGRRATIYDSPVGLEKYFVGQYQGVEPYYNNVVRGRRLKHVIDLCCNDFFMLDGSEKNLAVCKVVEGMDDGGAVWRGSLVALKETRSGADCRTLLRNPRHGYGHMDMRDLREVVDYLTNWKRTASQNYPTQPSSQQCFFLFMLLCFCSISWLVGHYLL